METPTGRADSGLEELKPVRAPEPLVGCRIRQAFLNGPSPSTWEGYSESQGLGRKILSPPLVALIGDGALCLGF